MIMFLHSVAIAVLPTWKGLGDCARCHQACLVINHQSEGDAGLKGTMRVEDGVYRIYQALAGVFIVLIAALIVLIPLLLAALWGNAHNVCVLHKNKTG